MGNSGRKVSVFSLPLSSNGHIQSLDPLLFFQSKTKFQPAFHICILDTSSRILISKKKILKRFFIKTFQSNLIYNDRNQKESVSS